MKDMPRIEIDTHLLNRFVNISNETLTMQLYHQGLRQCFLRGLKPLNRDHARFVGIAFTMRLIPAREDIDTYDSLLSSDPQDNLQWEAVKQIGEYEVLIVDSRNCGEGASGGDILFTYMMQKGVAGVVTDGALRDSAQLSQMPFPAYAREICATTRVAHHHVADIQVPISCSNVAVYPGDVLVGDGEGVVVVPRHLAPKIIDACEQQEALEDYILQRLLKGEDLQGLYPPTPKIKAEFEEWRKI